MIVIIDAYNLIKSVFATNKSSEAEIKKILQILKTYAASHLKHEFIMIFDGGKTTFAESIKDNNFNQVYVGYHKSADDYIKVLLEDLGSSSKKTDSLLATSDKELRSFAQERGIESINSNDFWQLITYKSADPINKKLSLKVHKTSENFDEELDRLMMEFSNIRSVTKSEDLPIVRKSKADVLSKKEKKLLRLLEKLK